LTSLGWFYNREVAEKEMQSPNLLFGLNVDIRFIETGMSFFCVNWGGGSGENGALEMMIQSS